jgi:hypothetical protein
MTKGFRYSYNLIGFQGEDVAKSIDRLARLGYDAVEVEGEPQEASRRCAAEGGAR